MRRIILLLIKVYQIFSSALWCSSCRFHPNCSQYGYEAFSRFGFCKATVLVIRRLARCHPWNVGGFDPLPNLDDGS